MFPFEVTKEELLKEEEKMRLESKEFAEFAILTACTYMMQNYEVWDIKVSYNSQKVGFDVITPNGKIKFGMNISCHEEKSIEEYFNFIIEKVKRKMK